MWSPFLSVTLAPLARRTPTRPLAMARPLGVLTPPGLLSPSGQGYGAVVSAATLTTAFGSPSGDCFFLLRRGRGGSPRFALRSSAPAAAPLAWHRGVFFCLPDLARWALGKYFLRSTRAVAVAAVVLRPLALAAFCLRRGKPPGAWQDFANDFFFICWL